MKSRRISVYGVISIFVSLLASTCSILAQNSTASSPAPAATPTGPLHFVEGPPNALKSIIASALQSPTFVSRAGNEGVNTQDQAIASQSLAITGPLPVYDINTIAAANNLRMMASPSRWLFFVEAGGKSICVADMMAHGAGKAVVDGFEFTTSEPTASTLKTLAALEQIKIGSYEVRYLRSQADGLKAIWLKSLNGGTDYVYVSPSGLYGAPGQRNGIQADKLYPLDEFVKLFLPILQKRAAPPDNPNAYD